MHDGIKNMAAKNGGILKAVSENELRSTSRWQISQKASWYSEYTWGHCLKGFERKILLGLCRNEKSVNKQCLLDIPRTAPVRP